jgi:hypothetical protein
MTNHIEAAQEARARVRALLDRPTTHEPLELTPTLTATVSSVRERVGALLDR